MTTDTTLSPLPADLADAATYDFYRQVHKGLRHALFQTTIHAGNLDVTDDAAVVGFLTAHTGLLGLLHSHHHHEDHFIQPMVERFVPAVAGAVVAQHHEVEARMARLADLGARLGTAATATRSSLALTLHLELSELTTAYLAHQLVEERDVMAGLRAAVSTDELFAVDMAIRMSVPPDEMVAYMAHMLPAMDVEERVEMLGGMAMAPPEVFAVFRAAAERILAPAEYAVVAARIGLP